METETKKRVLRSLTYGLYVVTAASGEEVAAATVTWLSQASFNPPLVMVAIRNDGHLHALVDRTRAFAVNVVADNQREIASSFFRPSKLETGRLNDHAFERGPTTGSPLLVELPAWFEARVTDVVPRGDHTVYVAEVVSVGLRDPNWKPLELSDTEWSYGG